MLGAARSVRYSNPNQARYFIKLAIKVAIESEIQSGIAECYLERGKIYLVVDKFKKATEVFKKALHHSRLSGVPELICKSFFNLAVSKKGYTISFVTNN